MPTRYLLALLPAVIALSAHFVTPSEAPAPAAETSEVAAFVATPQEMPQPGAEHAFLKERVGTWDVSSKFRMSPEMPWMESKATETVTSVCGGFFIQSVQKGKIMNMAFEGRLQLGYDTHKKKFVGTWIDNWGSYQSILEGTLSKDKKLMTLHSKMYDPMSGKTMNVRMVTAYEGKDKAVFSMYMPGPDGKEILSMEQTLTRKGKGAK